MQLEATKRRPRNNPEVSHQFESETSPNESYTIQELMLRHSEGIRPDIEKEPQYEMEHFGEQINPLREQNFDLSDLDAIRDEKDSLNTKLLEVQTKRAQELKNKEKQQIIEEYKQEQSKLLKKQQDDNN